MEILSFFSNSSDFVNLFNDFIDNYPAVKLSDQDVDTKFYIKVNSDRNEIYFHYLLNDIEEEFSYNYTENEITFTVSKIEENNNSIKQLLCYGFLWKTWL